MELNPGGIKPVVGNTGLEVVGNLAGGAATLAQKAIKARAKSKATKAGVGAGMTQAEKLELIDKVTEASEKLDKGAHLRTMAQNRLANKHEVAMKTLGHQQSLEKAQSDAELAKDASFHHLFLSTEFAQHVQPGSPVTFKGPNHEVNFTTPETPRQPEED
jgi:hypothetical protein